MDTDPSLDCPAEIPSLRIKLRPHQVEWVDATDRDLTAYSRILFLSACGTGKCLGAGTKVLMFDGTIKAVENVAVGDVVMGPDSLPRTVTTLCRGREKMYRVVPVKGDPYIVNASHILSLKATTGNRHITVNGVRYSHGDVMNISASQYANANTHLKRTTVGWRTGCNFPLSPLNPDMPPYMLGLWLGDGHQWTYAITKPDPEVLQSVTEYAATIGHQVTTRISEGPTPCPTHYVTNVSAWPAGRGHRTNRATAALHALGVLGAANKHIPHAYKTASREDRLQLLAGILDSDGHMYGSGFDYISKSERLCSDVAFVARSLGFAAYYYECQKGCQNGFVGTYYRLSISGDCSVIPNRIARRKAPIRKQVKSVTVTGIQLEDIGDGDYYGFSLDGPNGLFLLGDFTVTHNSTVFASLAHRWVGRGHRVLILSNRERLVHQTAKRVENETGIPVEVEMGAESASPYASIVVASVQTLSRLNRLTAFAPNHFALIVADEAHFVLAPSWMRILRYFHYGSDSLKDDWVQPDDGSYDPLARVVGFTATPELPGRAHLGQFFHHTSVSYSYLQAVQDGWLCEPRELNIPVKVDVLRARTKRTENGVDFNAEDLSAALIPVIEELAEQVATHAKDRKTMAFLPSVECARLMSEALTRRGMNAIFISGYCIDKTEKTDAFASSGAGTVACLAVLHCLDMQTEILTARGFKRHDDLTGDDLVANWNPDGSVFFEKPITVFKRPLAPGEHMVSFDHRTLRMRVTNSHDIVIRPYGKNCGAQKIKAEAAGRGRRMPTCGVAPPFNMSITDECDGKSRRRIVSNSWRLRNICGYSYEDSVTEATRREKRRMGLRRKQPNELTLDDCRFIGFWIADGSYTKSPNGNSPQYTATQSTVYPKIIEWFDGVVGRIGISFRKTVRKQTPNSGADLLVWWCFPRGTGGGSQERNGLYPLEPYLKKRGTDLFWALNEAQFDALVEGYWYGDGAHGKAENGFPSSISMTDTKKEWIDLLCAIGSVRGWRCNMIPRPQKNQRHNTQYYLRMIKGADVMVRNVDHAPYSPEDVWCVRVKSGAIITRHRGSVVVTGNSFGIDFPDVDCIAWFRATLSKAFYIQAVSRATRVLPGVLDGCATPEDRIHAIASSAKPSFLIISPFFVSDRINLCDPFDLYVDKPELKERMKKDGLTPDAAVKAERDFLKQLEKEAKKHKDREMRQINPLAHSVSLGDSRLKDYVPTTPAEQAPVTSEERELIAQAGFNPWDFKCSGQAQLFIRTLVERERQGLATPKQVRQLQLYTLRQRLNWLRPRCPADVVERVKALPIEQQVRELEAALPHEQLEMLDRLGFSDEKIALMTKKQAGAIMGKLFGR